MEPLSLPLTTDRLSLRAYRETDAEALLPIYSREDVVQFLLCEPWSAEEARTEIAQRSPKTGLDTESRALSLIVETKDGLDGLEGSVVIGDVSIWLTGDSAEKAEMGWVLNPAAGGHGFASEAATALLNVAFDHYGLHRVIAQMDARNTASAKMAERLGMTCEAHLRQDWWSKGEWTDTLVFGMLSTDRHVA